MKRLTAEKLAGLFFQAARDLREPETMQSAIAYQNAAENVRDNLVPQWQDEAIEGPCWVRGVDSVCSVYHWHDDEHDGDGGWSIEYIKPRDDGSSEMRWEPLNGRQVCPIGARPR